MKKKPINTFLLCASIILSSCVTVTSLKSNLKPTEINNVIYVAPQAFISLIKKGNTPILNDSLSLISGNIEIDIIRKSKEKLHVSDEFFPTDTLIQNRLKKEIFYLFSLVDKQKTLTSIKTTPLLDSIIELNGRRFGLLTINIGFTRTERNYYNQQAIDAGIALATLGTYDTKATKCKSTLYVMLIDAQENDIAYYNVVRDFDKEPTDKNNLLLQTTKAFDAYFK